MKKENLKIEIETIQSDQPRPYADSYYQFIIKTNADKYQLENIIIPFCTKVLEPCKQNKTEWKSYSEDPSSYFAGYYTFTKKDDGVYEYYVCLPFAD